MKFKIGDKVTLKHSPYDVMTIQHSGNMFDWSVIDENGKSDAYDEDELELYTEDKPVKKIVWSDTRVLRIYLSGYLTQLNLQPGKFILMDDNKNPDYVFIVFVKSEQ